jgi:hypothetical protein
MTELRNYLESHRNVRIALVGMGFLVASLSLFMGLALNFLVQGADRVLVISFVVVALALDLAIGWTLRLHTRRRLWTSIFLSSVGILAGTVLASMAIWRTHWFELVKEIFGVAITMH